MLTGNFNKNFSLNTLNKYTLRKINLNKPLSPLSPLFNKSPLSFNFSKKFRKNLFENSSINKIDLNNKNNNNNENQNENQSPKNFYNKNLNNQYNNFNKNFSNNEINEIDIEKKFDNLINKINMDMNTEEINNNNNIDNFNLIPKGQENNPEKNLEDFKAYIKSTINIPKTDFNDRMNIKENEINKLNKITEDYYMEQLGIFQDSEGKNFFNKKNKLWITHDVPTQIMGNPHFNILNNKIFKDAINRIKNLQGYRVLYKPGFSCFGRETENFIFKKLNKKKFRNIEELLDHKFKELTNDYENDLEENNENDNFTNHDNPNENKGLKALKESERKSFNLSRQKALYFREECRKYIEEYILKQKEYFKRMGIMSYYNYSYSTYEKNYEKKQLDFFQELWEKGLIFRDYRKILWSENRQQILEKSEIEENSELRESCIIKFPIVELSNDLKEIAKNFPNKSFNFLGFTASPYKYIGIQALSINDEADYCIAEFDPIPEPEPERNFNNKNKKIFGKKFRNKAKENNSDFIICAYKRFPEICKRLNKLKSFKIHFVAKGWAFKNLIAKDPIFNRRLPIISIPEVSVLFGTGINLISPAHDSPFDYEENNANDSENNIARKYNLSMKSYLDQNNNFCKSLGLFFYNTNAFYNGDFKIIKKLQEKKSILLTYKYESKFLSCKKTGEKISCRTIGSFFLKIDEKLKNQVLKELAFVKFFPELNFEERRFKKKYDERKLRYSPRKKKLLEGKSQIKDYFNVIEELENISEWCISEYNNWGIPVPYFINKQTGNILMDSNVIKYVKKLFNEYGSDIWFSWDIKDLLPDEYKEEAENYITGKENFDWIFDTAISWYASAELTEEEVKSLKELEDYRKMNYLKENNFEFNRIKENEEKENYLKRKELNEIDENGNNLNTGNDLYFKDEKEKKIDEYFSNIPKDLNNNDINNPFDKEENLFEKFSYETDKIKDLIPTPILKEHLITKINNLITKPKNSTEKASIPTNNNNNPIKPNFFDIIIEGKNEHSLWLLMSSLTSVSFSNFNIYKRVLTHGYILDSMGKEISEKNFKDALDIVDGTVKRFSNRDYGNGADSLRLYFLRHSFEYDYKLFEEDILKNKNEIKKIRKISKNIISLLSDYDENKIENYLINKFKIHMEELDILDQILYYEFLKFYEKSLKNIEDYNISELIENILKFLNKTFNEFYFDSAKFVIINYKKNDIRRLIKQFILKEILLNSMKLLHAIIPFTTEDIYSHMYFLKEKQKFLGFNEYEKLENLKENFEFKLSKFQENNFEYKAKLIIQIKNKFLYFLQIIIEKIKMKNNLKESEYYNNEENPHDYLPEEIEKFDINKLKDVEKQVKYFEKNVKKSNLKVNLIENENFYLNNDNNNNLGYRKGGNLLLNDANANYDNNKEMMVYKNDLYGSDLVEYDKYGMPKNVKPKRNQKRFYLPKQNELEIILLIKEKDSYEYQLFDELEKSDLLDSYFGVAKCYVIIEDDLEKNDEFALRNKSSEYQKIIENKQVLTEAEFVLKNDYIAPTEGKKIIKTTMKMTIMKNENFKCIRCNFLRCSEENKICSTCKFILKDEI